MSSLMEAREVSAAYGARRVLSDVSVDLHSGEILGLVGPNGAGKSTLLRVLSGVLRPTTGWVSVLGDRLDHLSERERARRVAVVAQSGVIPGSFTAAEIVMLGRTPHIGAFGRETAHDRDVVDRALALAGAGEWRDRRLAQLSGGERQRVLIARALAQEARVLLLDEPTTHLDFPAQSQVLHLARRLANEEGHGVLAVLHDLTLAAQHCDRVVLMVDGRVAAEGAPAEVLTPDRLAAAYGVAPRVVPHPDTGLPVVLPI